METIGDRIKKRREELQISTRDLAKSVGISHVAISKLETGLSKAPSAENLFALAYELRISPQTLLFGEDRYPVANWSRQQAPIAVGWPFTATHDQIENLEPRDLNQLDRVVSSFVQGLEEEQKSKKSHEAR